MIICADLLVIAAELPPVDVVITDPPYSPHVHAKTTSVNTRAGRGVTQRDLGFGALTPALRQGIARIAPSRWSVVFSDVEGTHAWRESFPSNHYVRALPWVRWSQPQLSGDRPPTGCEMISLFHPPTRKRWNGHGGQTHYDHPEAWEVPAFEHQPERSKEKYTAEKPLDLLLELVSSFSDPGELVLDPCAGVGTTAVACAMLGRECIGLEIIPEIAAAAEARERTPWERDLLRAERWVSENLPRAREAAARQPRNKSEQPAWERAKRRFNDLERVRRAVSK